MFKMITTAFLTIASVTAAIAQDDAAAKQRLCTNLGGLADAIMEYRQEGLPISAAMAALDADNPVDQAARGLILIAYDTPRFSGEEFQMRARANFRNEVELACYQKDWD